MRIPQRRFAQAVVVAADDLNALAGLHSQLHALAAHPDATAPSTRGMREPYSLAMVLLEAVGGGGGQAAWDVKLLATDISTRVLAHARRGTYDKKRAEGVPPQLRNKHLAVNKLDGRVFYDASPALKDLVSFRHLNLIQTWPFAGPFDFIFCRNVMIYFDKPTQQRLVGRFYDCLAPGGVLFTGHSESLTGITHGFKYVQPTIYAKP
jgi:chemotaxis protein methyltransferase CheR